MKESPKHPLNGKDSKFVEVDKATWDSVPAEHRSTKRIREAGGFYKTIRVISPEANRELKNKTEEKAEKTEPKAVAPKTPDVK